jgi:hypothetical protein
MCKLQWREHKKYEKVRQNDSSKTHNSSTEDNEMIEMLDKKF